MMQFLSDRSIEGRSAPDVALPEDIKQMSIDTILKLGEQYKNMYDEHKKLEKEVLNKLDSYGKTEYNNGKTKILISNKLSNTKLLEQCIDLMYNKSVLCSETKSKYCMLSLEFKYNIRYPLSEYKEYENVVMHMYFETHDYNIIFLLDMEYVDESCISKFTKYVLENSYIFKFLYNSEIMTLSYIFKKFCITKKSFEKFISHTYDVLYASMYTNQMIIEKKDSKNTLYEQLYIYDIINKDSYNKMHESSELTVDKETNWRKKLYESKLLIDVVYFRTLYKYILIEAKKSKIINSLYIFQELYRLHVIHKYIKLGSIEQMGESISRCDDAVIMNDGKKRKIPFDNIVSASEYFDKMLQYYTTEKGIELITFTTISHINDICILLCKLKIYNDLITKNRMTTQVSKFVSPWNINDKQLIIDLHVYNMPKIRQFLASNIILKL